MLLRAYNRRHRKLELRKVVGFVLFLAPNRSWHAFCQAQAEAAAAAVEGDEQWKIDATACGLAFLSKLTVSKGVASYDAPSRPAHEEGP